MFVTINPADGQEQGRLPGHDDAYVEHAVAAAHEAQRRWAKVPVVERCELLGRMARALRAHAERLARLITLEMGKPLSEAKAEVEKCAGNCDFYAEHAPAWLADKPIATSASDCAVVYDPLGVVLAIMPWNYPLWQFFRFIAPALAAGNGALLKHASNVPQCALAIGEVMRAAGAPEGLVGVLLIPPSAVAALIADPRVAAVTLTGSTEVGAKVAAQAGGALKKQVLELGGSDPFIVLADADLELAAAQAVKARFLNAGQACINAKRFIVVEEAADRFVQLFVQHARALRVGDPLDPATTMGPLARADLRDTLHAQVERTVAAGGRLMLGGAPVAGPGYFYPPTIIDHVEPAMAAACEETFGPLAAVSRVKDTDAAIDLANATEFGLGASLWTRDTAGARALARRIDAGGVFVNAIVVSDSRVPFGGIKRSGYGRELGESGLKEFVNQKTVWVS
jgi:succinate-semialdehyde dehydrogenase/glutarate-semialdehyde dehydrogenase